MSAEDFTMNDIIIYDADDEQDGTIPLPVDLDAEIVAKQHEIIAASKEAQTAIASLQQEQAGTGLVLRSDNDVNLVKRRMVDITKRVKETRVTLKAKQKELANLQREQMERIQQEMELVLRPMQEMVERMQEGIESVNLYLGTREDIVCITEGKPAPADTPVHVRQRVLAMDEEMMVGASQGGTVAVAGDIHIFDEWVQQPGNLDQVLPEEKGIVGLVSRWTRWGDDPKWIWTYFLIRNGENVYRIVVEDFIAGRHLIPTVDQFTSYFTSKDRYTGKTSKIEPGTEAWAKAEKNADKEQRHFMKIALVLQGLMDRTAVLHPLPENGLSFLHEQDYHDGKIVAITDAEKALTTGKETFKQWQERLLGEMRPGMRVIGAFNSLAWRTANAQDEDDPDAPIRKTPKSASDPKSGTPYAIEGMTNDGGMTFKYKRTDKVRRKVLTRSKWETHPDTYDKEKNPEGIRYHYKYDAYDYEYDEPKTRATCTFYPTDDFILPFDLATVEQMESFLDNREDRQHYITMLPLIKSAIDAKRAEQEDEAPMRQLLVGALMQENGLDHEDAEAQVDDLILWFKYTNKHHRALGEDETKAISMIVTESKRRIKAAKADAKVVELILEVHRDALLVARKRNGRYVVLTPQNERNVFVTSREFGPRSGFTEPEEWKVVEPRYIAGWDIAYTGEAWKHWKRDATRKHYLTDPERGELLEQIKGKYGSKLMAVSYYEEVTPRKAECYFNAYSTKGEFILDEAHPLTGKPEEAELVERAFYWERGKDGIKLLDQRKYGDSRTINSTWAYRGWQNEYPKRRVWDTHGYVTNLFEDLAVLNSYEAAEHQHKIRVRAICTPARNLRARAYESVRDQWKAREWAKLRAKFIEEYMDPDLWEDHRQTIKHPVWPVKKRGTSWDRQQDPLMQYITRFVEEGIDFDGMTVQELQDDFTSRGFLVTPSQWESDNVPLPESIMDIVIDTKEKSDD